MSDNQIDTGMSIDEAAKLLGISKRTLYERVKSVPHTKRFGKLRFFKDQLQAYMRGEYNPEPTNE